MFAGVRHLEPGHWLRIDRQGIETQRWWDLSRQQTEERVEVEWTEEPITLLDDSVRLRLRCDVAFGVFFLSGGVDSSTVVGMMSRHLTDPVRTYSIGFNEKRFDESPYAAQAAQRFSTNH